MSIMRYIALVQLRDTTRFELLITLIAVAAVILTSSFAPVVIRLMPPLILGILLGKTAAFLIRYYQNKN